MSISDLFDSGFRNRNKGHFSAIVRVALSDGTITPHEKQFLDKYLYKVVHLLLTFDTALKE